jgi:hypothetical protein
MTQMFTSREMLVYGSRSSIDSVLSRMVKDGFIFRLARGVYIRDVTRLPSAFEIAEVKLTGYGINASSSNEKILKTLPGFEMPSSAHVFAKQGSSTKFWDCSWGRSPQSDLRQEICFA